MKNKLLETIEKNNEEFEKTERGRVITKIIGCQKHGADKNEYIKLWDDLHNDDIYFIKEYYTQSRIKELEVLVKELQEKAKEAKKYPMFSSKGKLDNYNKGYNEAVDDIIQTLKDTIKELKS